MYVFDADIKVKNQYAYSINRIYQAKKGEIMKRFLTLSLTFLIIAMIAVGCTNKDTDNDNIEDDIQNDVEKFEGTISTSWNDVKADYDKIDAEVKEEVEDDYKVTKEDVQDLVNTIETKYDKIKDGITEDNEEDAKGLYRAAQKIQEIAKVDGQKVDHEIVTLSENAKALVKHYYGEAEEDFSTVKEDFTTGIDKIKNYTEEEWQKFLDLFK